MQNGCCACVRERQPPKPWHISHHQSTSKWSRKATGLGTVRSTGRKGGTDFALSLSSLEQGSRDLCVLHKETGRQ